MVLENLIEVFSFFARDDFGFISQVQQLSKPFELFIPSRIWFYRPLSQQFYFWVNYKLFGLNAVFYHITNLFFHFFSTFLLYKISKFLFLKFSPKSEIRLATYFALVTATLWGLSTIHLLDVLWISGFSMVGGVFFILLSFYLYLQNKKYLSLFVYLLGLMSNEVTLVFPFVLYFYELFYKKDTFTKISIINSFKGLWYFFILVFGYLIFYLSYTNIPKGEYGLTISPVLNVITFIKYFLYPLVNSFSRKSMFSSVNYFIIMRSILLFIPVLLFLYFLLKKKIEKSSFASFDWRLVLFTFIWFFLFNSFFALLPHHTFSYMSSAGSIGVFMFFSYFLIKFTCRSLLKLLLTIVFLLQLTILINSFKTDPDFLWLHEYTVGAKEYKENYLTCHKLAQKESRGDCFIPVESMTLKEREYSYYGNLYKVLEYED